MNALDEIGVFFQIQMTNPPSSAFDDDDINDDDLLAACNEIIEKKPDPIVPTGNMCTNFSIMKNSFPYSHSPSCIIWFSIRTISNSSRFHA